MKQPVFVVCGHKEGQVSVVLRVFTTFVQAQAYVNAQLDCDSWDYNRSKAQAYVSSRIQADESTGWDYVDISKKEIQE